MIIDFNNNGDISKQFDTLFKDYVYLSNKGTTTQALDPGQRKLVVIEYIPETDNEHVVAGIRQFGITGTDASKCVVSSWSTTGGGRKMQFFLKNLTDDMITVSFNPIVLIIKTKNI